MDGEVRWETVHCTLTIRRPTAGVVVLVYTGTDVGELGDRPFRELERDVGDPGPLELWVDARDTRNASVDVSSGWAAWFLANRARIHRVHVLPGSDLLEITMDFVSRFTGLGARMRIFRDPATFDAALATAMAAGHHRP